MPEKHPRSGYSGRKKPFICPKCHHRSEDFQVICPECGQRFIRDFLDVQLYPKDPDPTGSCTDRFWIQVFLLLTLAGFLYTLLLWSGALKGVTP
ncbi:MAG: hypothetical protein GYA23_00645 [Methanomicrobiales archaeon]|nr:hypothetical protein [Methanomicrobiales archaeon]